MIQEIVDESENKSETFPLNYYEINLATKGDGYKEFSEEMKKMKVLFEKYEGSRMSSFFMAKKECIDILLSILENQGVLKLYNYIVSYTKENGSPYFKDRLEEGNRLLFEEVNDAKKQIILLGCLFKFSSSCNQIPNELLYNEIIKYHLASHLNKYYTIYSSTYYDMLLEEQGIDTAAMSGLIWEM